MKKNIISFSVFVVAFLVSLVLIHYKANPTTKFMDAQEHLEWHGQVENEYGTYDGTLIDDLFTGDGDFRFLTGEVYSGDWQDSYMEGNGVLLFPEIGEYKGELSNSMRNGQGIFTWDSGEIYEGDWKKDKMSGDGTYTFSSGATLTGIFKNNKPISGTLLYKDKAKKDDPETTIVSLEYSFSEDKETIIFSTKGGLKYDGDLSGLFNKGNTTITYPSGNIYSGQLVEGMRDGTGKYEWKDSSGETLSYYDGNWSSDHMSGPGEYHFSSSEYPYLSGNFENDVPSGTLVYYKEAGNTFETIWENGICVSVKET
ncbi:MAG: hypothetical protein Q4D81_12810 [Eubacteriales bacterium]|nr:hypothetical protein [Eubacteriales bacterium]